MQCMVGVVVWRHLSRPCLDNTRRGSAIFCVSSCFLWLAKLKRRVACFSHKETQEDAKSTKNVPEDSGQNVELDYLKLLDWTGRQFRTDKRGVIPAGCTPILNLLDYSEEAWLDLVRNFRKRCRNEAGFVLSVCTFRSKRQERRAQAAGV